MRHTYPSSITALGVSALLCAATVEAEVRQLTLGIQVNCPPGLGECWGKGIGEGVAKMPAIASIEEEADGATQTAVVRSQGGRLVNLDALSQHLATLRMGARLRSVEAVVAGSLERRGSELVLRVSETDETLRLRPLTKKTQWNRKENREFAATERELRAHELLRAGWSGGRQDARIIGPLRAIDSASEMELEVREAYFFGRSQPSFDALDLGIRVSSPYGLGDSWLEVRHSLIQFNGFARIAEPPDALNSVVTVHPQFGSLPDLTDLGARLSDSGVGAAITGIEATLEGRVESANGQLVLRTSDSDVPLPLAPLTRKIQWDLRQQRSAKATDDEREAYSMLLDRTPKGAPRVRVTGPVIESEDRTSRLLEVRSFLLNPSPGNLPDSPALRAIGCPRAIARDQGSVFLDWESSGDPRAVGYHVYRSTKADGRYTRVSRKPLTDSELTIRGEDRPQRYFYSVTVVDEAGYESRRSPAIDARPPESPGHLIAQSGDNVVQLDWEKSLSADLDSYSIHRSEKANGPYTMISGGVLGLSFTDYGAENGRTYHYVVTAVDSSSNQSAFSTEVSVTPLRGSQESIDHPQSFGKSSEP